MLNRSSLLLRGLPRIWTSSVLRQSRLPTNSPIKLGHRSSIAAKFWQVLHKRVMLRKGPRLPFSPHLIGEENDEQIVHDDKRERCACRYAEYEDRRDQSEGERDFVGLVELCTH